jgi:hypothetical protein
MPLRWRLPFSLAWLAMITLVNAINGWLNRGSPDDCVIVGVLLLCQWLLLQFPLWGIAVGFGVQLRHTDEIGSGEHPIQRQFGIRQLMLLTAVVGVLFGVGRIAVPYLFREFVFLPVVAPVIAFLIVAEVVMTLPLVVAALLRRHTVIGGLLALTLIGAITACELPLLKLVVSGGSSSVQEIIALNIGTATATLALLTIVRLNGYSLSRSRPARRLRHTWRRCGTGNNGEEVRDHRWQASPHAPQAGDPGLAHPGGSVCGIRLSDRGGNPGDEPEYRQNGGAKDAP